MKIKVLFLDFDGVLNSRQYLRDFGSYGIAIDPQRMKLLKEIIDVTQAKIVLSTTWRAHWEKDDDACKGTGRYINKLFGDYGLEVYSKTPVLGVDREDEIKAWLDKHPETDNFAVLDDKLLDADFLRGHFVRTSALKEGLDEETKSQTIEILNKAEESKSKKIFVVSDVHGYFSIMKDALDKAGFDAQDDSHLLVCLGDYFDRGNENTEVMKYFEKLRNCVLLRGNHEDMLLRLLNTGKIEQHHRINGTANTLENFFGKSSFDMSGETIDFTGKTRTVDRICDFIYDKSNYYETEKFVFVHGWLPSGCNDVSALKNVSDAAWEQARKDKWHLNYKGKPPIEGKTLVCGHVPTFYAGAVEPSWDKNCSDIFYGNGIIAIDAGTHDTKRMNVLVIEDRLI